MIYVYSMLCCVSGDLGQCRVYTQAYLWNSQMVNLYRVWDTVSLLYPPNSQCCNEIINDNVQNNLQKQAHKLSFGV